MPYRVYTALDTDIFPEYIKQSENSKKDLLRVIYPFYDSMVRGNKSILSKKYVYNGI